MSEAMAQIVRRELRDGRIRWTLRVDLGRDPSGKRKIVTKTFDRKKDAEAEGRRLERLRDMGAQFANTSMAREPFISYLKRWLEAKAGEVRPRTLDDYSGIIARYVENPPEGAPPIGSVRLDRLAPEAFEALYTWMRNAGLSPRTIEYTHTVLRSALKDAVARKVLAANPTDHAKVPRRRKIEGTEEQTAVKAMTEEEARRFIEAARSDRYFALWLLLLTGGLRPGEALGLKWSDIDFENSRIQVVRSLTRRGVEGGGWRLTPPKTATARRTVPLPESTMKALREWKRQTARERLLAGSEYEDTDGLAFVTPFGSALHLSNLHRGPWRRIMEGAELGEREPEPPKPARGPRAKPRFRPAFRIYDLRHTCATLLLKRGVSPKVVQERLGHSSVTLTLDTYSHVLPTMQQVAADELEAMLGGG